MLQVFHNSNFRLMWGTKWVLIAFSILALAVSVSAMVVKGFNFGIDFAGGTAVQIKFRNRPRVEDLRTTLEHASLGDINIQRIGDVEDNEVLIRVEQQRVVPKAAGSEGGEISEQILGALRTAEEKQAVQAGKLDLNAVSETDLQHWLATKLAPAPAGAAPAEPQLAATDDGVAAAVTRYRNEHGGLIRAMDEIETIPGMTPRAAAALKEGAVLGDFALRGVDFVGPTAGRELLHNTGLAILGSVIGILIYVYWRFHKIAWGVASIVALVHDVTIAAGAMALTGKEFSLAVVAALLTILGYSINDTIVVFDRIRENLRLYREYDFEEVVNASVNQTLSRTVLTSFTVFVAVTALFLYGGDKLNPLSFCLMVGVIFGSYSSIFVAAALLVVIYRYLGAKHVKS
jgi:preprotein translocase subunit SecF